MSKEHADPEVYDYLIDQHKQALDLQTKHVIALEKRLTDLQSAADKVYAAATLVNMDYEPSNDLADPNLRVVRYDLLRELSYALTEYAGFRGEGA